MSIGAWTKFDLTRASVSRVSLISEIFRRAGAWKASVLLESREPEIPAGAIFSLIKVPALEGTEIWLVEQSAQSRAERDAGFERPSESLASVESAQLLGLAVLDPADEERELSIRASGRPSGGAP